MKKNENKFYQRMNILLLLTYNQVEKNLLTQNIAKEQFMSDKFIPPY